LAGFHKLFCRIHRAQSVTLSYVLLTALVLLSSVSDGEIQHSFLQNGVILHACVHGCRKDFFQGGH